MTSILVCVQYEERGVGGAEYERICNSLAALMSSTAVTSRRSPVYVYTDMIRAAIAIPLAATCTNPPKHRTTSNRRMSQSTAPLGSYRYPLVQASIVTAGRHSIWRLNPPPCICTTHTHTYSHTRSKKELVNTSH